MNRREFVCSTGMLTALSAPDTALAASRGEELRAAPTEELVTAMTEDGFPLTGLAVTPPERVRQLAVIWVHGAGQNFYFPSYVAIARAAAARGQAFFTVNTRMHDIGCFLSYSDQAAIRGGTYWGLPSKEPLDVGVWVSTVVERGYPEVVLVGHSAGGPAVRRYLTEHPDPRVMGMVMASVTLSPPPRAPADERLAAARAMVAANRGTDFLPNFRMSAQTYADMADVSEDIRDFYGIDGKTTTPAISRLRCPMLAWFGTREPDEGTAADLERLRSIVAKLPSGPSQLDTAMIEGADHLYEGQALQIAQVLTEWIARLPAAQRQPNALATRHRG